MGCYTFRAIISLCSKLFRAGLLQWDSTLRFANCTCLRIGIESPLVFSPIISSVALTKGICNEVLTTVRSTCFATSLPFYTVSSTLINRCSMWSTGFNVLVVSKLTLFFSTYCYKSFFDAGNLYPKVSFWEQLSYGDGSI